MPLICRCIFTAWEWNCICLFASVLNNTMAYRFNTMAYRFIYR